MIRLLGIALTALLVAACGSVAQVPVANKAGAVTVSIAVPAARTVTCSARDSAAKVELHAFRNDHSTPEYMTYVFVPPAAQHIVLISCDNTNPPMQWKAA